MRGLRRRGQKIQHIKICCKPRLLALERGREILAEVFDALPSEVD